MGDQYTNTIDDTQISGRTPDGDGDFYYIGDRNRDFNYLIKKIVDAIRGLGSDPAGSGPQILFGGVVSEGTGAGTVDISEGLALSEDENGNKRLLRIPALTGVTVPAALKTGGSIFVTTDYEYTLNASTRTHYDGDSYKYILEDSYTGESTPDDLFSATNDKDVLWGSFTMTAGNLYTELNFRSPELNATTHKVVSSQKEFESLFARSSANIYEVASQFNSVYIKDKGSAYDFLSVLTGGETYGIMRIPAGVRFEGENLIEIGVGDTGSYMQHLGGGGSLKNIYIKGIGTTPVSIAQSFSLSAGVTVENCKTSHRSSTVSFAGFTGNATDYTSKYSQLEVHDITSTAGVKAVNGLNNLIGLTMYDCSAGTNLNILSGCKHCKGIWAEDLSSTGFATFISSCDKVSDIFINNTGITLGDGASLIAQSHNISKVRAYNIESSANNVRLIYNSTHIKDIHVTDVSGSGNPLTILDISDYCSDIYVQTISHADNNITLINDCEHVRNIKFEDITYSGSADINIVGIESSKSFSNIEILDVDITGSSTATTFKGINNSTDGNNFVMDLIDSANGPIHGFFDIERVNNIRLENLKTTGTGACYGGETGLLVSNVYIKDLDASLGVCVGLKGILNLSNFEILQVDSLSTFDAYGLEACDRVSSGSVTDIDAGGSGTAEGVKDCDMVASTYTTETTNTGNTNVGTSSSIP